MSFRRVLIGIEVDDNDKFICNSDCKFCNGNAWHCQLFNTEIEIVKGEFKRCNECINSDEQYNEYEE